MIIFIQTQSKCTLNIYTCIMRMYRGEIKCIFKYWTNKHTQQCIEQLSNRNVYYKFSLRFHNSIDCLIMKYLHARLFSHWFQWRTWPINFVKMENYFQTIEERTWEKGLEESKHNGEEGWRATKIKMKRLTASKLIYIDFIISMLSTFASTLSFSPFAGMHLIHLWSNSIRFISFNNWVFMNSSEKQPTISFQISYTFEYDIRLWKWNVFFILNSMWLEF